MSLDDLRATIVELLARIYSAVPWRKIRVKLPHDVFNHRVRAAATRATLNEFVSRLCNFFGLQSTSADVLDLLERLAPHEEEALDLIHREHITLVTRATVQASQVRRRNRKGVTDVRRTDDDASGPAHLGMDPAPGAADSPW